MDIQYFENIWSGRKSDKEENRAFWDGRAEEFNANAYKEEGRERLNKVFELLTSKGLLAKNGSVLDIGCGPGKYSVEFAKRSKNVAGVDLSPKMIEFAKENAAKEELSNVTFNVMDWAEADLKAIGWEKKFDLVFASMCPAIINRDALEKMISASKGYCFMSSFVERKNSLKDYLSQNVDLDKANSSFEKTAYCSFNILWLLGYYPDITYIDTEWEQFWTLERAVECYCTQLEMGRSINDGLRASVKNCMEQISENGMVKESIKAKIAWMYWKV